MTFPSTSRPARARAVRRWAGAAAVVVASSLALAGCSDDPTPVSDDTGTATEDPQPSETGSGAGQESAPASPTESPAESGSPSEPAASGTAVPVYFAGDGPGGRTVLFREFHRVEGDPLTEAARLVAGGGQPDDPDYRTLWPGVEISSVQATDGVLLVEIPSDGFTQRPDGMSRRDARLALQQLVYTLQGVQTSCWTASLASRLDIPSGRSVNPSEGISTRRTPSVAWTEVISTPGQSVR